MADKRPIIHIAAPAGSGVNVIESMRVGSVRRLLERIQETVGQRYRITGDPALLEAEVDERRGGRRDDRARVRELERCFANDEVAAIVPVRGGSWLLRLMPEIDFSLLDKRRRPLALVGFSEITPLINVLGRHRRGRAYYYMTPGFSGSGLHDFALDRADKLAGKRLNLRERKRFAREYARKHFDAHWRQYWRDVDRILTGRSPKRMLRGTVIAGRLPVVTRATFLGGCLSLATGMLSAGFRPRLDPRGKWIVLEDISEAIHRIDRQFAHFKIAGWFDACAGVLIGDFHDDVSDQFAAVRELLAFHVPRNLPVIHAPEVGHGWPQAMLPIGKPVTLRAAQSTRGAQKVELAAPWEKWRVIGES